MPAAASLATSATSCAPKTDENLFKPLMPILAASVLRFCRLRLDASSRMTWPFTDDTAFPVAGCDPPSVAISLPPYFARKAGSFSSASAKITSFEMKRDTTPFPQGQHISLSTTAAKGRGPLPASGITLGPRKILSSTVKVTLLSCAWVAIVTIVSAAKDASTRARVEGCENDVRAGMRGAPDVAGNRLTMVFKKTHLLFMERFSSEIFGACGRPAAGFHSQSENGPRTIPLCQ